MEQKFENIDIDYFFDNSTRTRKFYTGITVFTPKQRKIIRAILARMKKFSPKRYESFNVRFKNLTNLARDIERYPSLFDQNSIAWHDITPIHRLDSLLKHQATGDTTFQLPSKASLGRGFLITKIHTFSMLAGAAENIGEEKHLVRDLENETVTMMFSLLAEDVYLGCVCDVTLDLSIRRQMGLALLILWEHRNDEGIEHIAPILQSIWTARQKLAPVFGTMMGTSELVLMSMNMDEMWTHFIKERLNEPMVAQAMEEFLFGISFEQINHLRQILRGRGIKAIGRDEVSEFLGIHISPNTGIDYREFYSMYTIRRDNAHARARFNVPGPQKTLEDYFIQFVMKFNNENEERQKR